MPTTFHAENINFTLKDKPTIRQWIKDICLLHDKKTGHINFIFCDDKYLHQINLEYLAHDTYTDIITFDYCEGTIVEGDIFISIERVIENARENAVAFALETNRVIIHGVLHLLGLRDKTPTEKATMRKTEDDALITLTSLTVPRGTLKKLK